MNLGPKNRQKNTQSNMTLGMGILYMSTAIKYKFYSVRNVG